MGSTETIHTTANHPWLTADRGWVVAGALRSGEVVVTLDGQRGVVVTTQAVAGHAAMDTLTVAEDHTYAVGSGQWVVHNVGPIFTNPDLPPPPYFRGTTSGFPGNDVLQRFGLSPVSTDPLVSTAFAIEAETTNGGQGVVYILRSSDLSGVTVGAGSWFAELEKEVSLNLPPLEVADRAELSVSATDARGILQDMGFQLPSRIQGKSRLTEVLRETPRLSPEQIEEFISKASQCA